MCKWLQVGFTLQSWQGQNLAINLHKWLRHVLSVRKMISMNWFLQNYSTFTVSWMLVQPWCWWQYDRLRLLTSCHCSSMLTIRQIILNGLFAFLPVRDNNLCGTFKSILLYSRVWCETDLPYTVLNQMHFFSHPYEIWTRKIYYISITQDILPKNAIKYQNCINVQNVTAMTGINVVVQSTIAAIAILDHFLPTCTGMKLWAAFQTHLS